MTILFLIIVGSKGRRDPRKSRVGRYERELARSNFKGTDTCPIAGILARPGMVRECVILAQ